MLLKSLTLTNVRAFSHAEFTFQPGMNVIVGINGVGKSTVVDSLCILLGQAIGKFYGYKNRLRFSNQDLKINSKFINAKLVLGIADHEIHYDVNLPGRAQMIVELNPHNLKNPTLKDSGIVVYYSPHRAIASDKKINAPKSPVTDLNDALKHRELRLVEFTDWWNAQTYLAMTGEPNAQRHLDALNRAVTGLIDSCTVVRFQPSSDVAADDLPAKTPAIKVKPALLIDKAGVTLDVRQLSDGERGILALVLDLTRRLSQSNPKRENPLQGQAIVLIDELDLHLHPKWQRTIVHKLTTTFPNCQFIATTHSPLIIGEVPPENIILLEEGQPPLHPAQSLGMDTDWILKYLMDAPTRNLETDHELNRIADLIEAEDYDQALDAIDGLRNQIGGFPELVRLQTRIDRLQLLGE